MDGELSAAERLSIEVHLQKCASCAQEVESLAQLGLVLQGLPEETPSFAFTQGTVDRAAAMTRNLSRKNRLLHSLSSFVRVAAALLFGPVGYDVPNENSLSSQGYLRTFDDIPPGSFADVYLTVIEGGGN